MGNQFRVTVRKHFSEDIAEDAQLKEKDDRHTFGQAELKAIEHIFDRLK